MVHVLEIQDLVAGRGQRRQLVNHLQLVAKLTTQINAWN
jgi:hypothetical protein